MRHSYLALDTLCTDGIKNLIGAVKGDSSSEVNSSPSSGIKRGLPLSGPSFLAPGGVRQNQNALIREGYESHI